MKTLTASLLLVLVSFSGFGQSAVKQRLIGESYYNYDGAGHYALLDSLSFSYSGNRHSRFDYSTASALGIQNPWLNVWTNFYLYTTLNCNNIDSSFYPDPSFDVMEYYHLDSASVPISYKWSQQNDYLPNDMHAASRSFNKFDPGIENDGNEIIEYNSKGGLKRVLVTLGNANTGNFDTFLVRTFFYDSLDRLVLDTCTRFGRPYLRNEYTYNASGQYITKARYQASFTTGAYNPAEIFSYQYYPDGRVKSVSYGGLSGTTFVSASVDSFGYTAGLNGYTLKNTRTLDSVGYPAVNSHIEYCHVNSSGQRDTITEATINGTTVVGRIFHVLRYNKAGNPISYETYVPAAPLPNLASTFYYYYENYGESLAVGEPTSGQITLAPNPVTTTVSLHYAAEIPKQRLNVSISNMLGQLVHAESFIPRAEKTDIVLSNELPVGVYAIAVYGINNAVLYKGTFVKK